MDLKSNKEDIQKNKLSKSSNHLDSDQNEQAMNGAYGMLETKEEDRLNNSKK